MNRPKEENYYEHCGMVFHYEQYVEDMNLYCDRLEKALDRACDRLWNAEGILYKEHSMSKEEWKDYLLDD